MIFLFRTRIRHGLAEFISVLRGSNEIFDAGGIGIFDFLLQVFRVSINSRSVTPVREKWDGPILAREYAPSRFSHNDDTFSDASEGEDLRSVYFIAPSDSSKQVG